MSIFVFLIIYSYIIFNIAHFDGLFIIILLEHLQLPDLEAYSPKFDDVTLLDVELVALAWLVLVGVVPHYEPGHLHVVLVRVVLINVLVVEEPVHIVLVHDAH